ncbi:hypothetical protein [Shewanella sp.]|uniref:hypothetical protein n=1 Tax=Shewanella sp. TaxID=50422 RepID=UPI003A9754FE
MKARSAAHEVKRNNVAPLADGVSADHFAAVTTNQLRADFSIPTNKTMRLVALKAFR